MKTILKLVGITFCLFLISCNQKKEWHKGVSFTLTPEQVAEYEKNIDHAAILQDLNEGSYTRGKKAYQFSCHNCHGNIKDEGAISTATKFWNDKFKVGNDPFSMYQTITHGFATMPPQVQLVPREKYDIIHYIREEFIKENNPEEYVAIDKSYLESLPVGSSIGPQPKVSEPWRAMDYGNFLINTYELVDEGNLPVERSSGKSPLANEDFSEANMAYKGIAIRLDKGSGGVAAGNAWTIFDHDLFRVAGGWSGEGFIDWNGILLNGKHNISPATIGNLYFETPVAPGWANPETGSFDDPRFKGKDGRKFGPLPRKWAKYKGIYQHEEHTIVSYTVGNTEVLEEFGLEKLNEQNIFTRTLNLKNINAPLKMRIAPIGVG